MAASQHAAMLARQIYAAAAARSAELLVFVLNAAALLASLEHMRRHLREVISSIHASPDQASRAAEALAEPAALRGTP